LIDMLGLDVVVDEAHDKPSLYELVAGLTVTPVIASNRGLRFGQAMAETRRTGE